MDKKQCEPEKEGREGEGGRGREEWKEGDREKGEGKREKAQRAILEGLGPFLKML